MRVVPGASARYGSFLERGVVMMPSYVNIGAYVGHNTMVDTWATVGSCAQIGANVHLSGGVGIGGVLEPPQAAPVVVEDDCYIGSRCIVAEGAHVGRNSVLGAGLILTGTVPVIDAETGAEVGRGKIPPNTVAIMATRSRRFGNHEFGLPCALVIKHLARRRAPRQEPAQRDPPGSRSHGLTDLLRLTAELVDIPSESYHEAALTDHLESELRARAPWLVVDRLGNNLVARTQLGRAHAPGAGRPHRHGAGQRQPARPGSRPTRCGGWAPPT